MILKSTGLLEVEALDNVKAVVGSEYFREYGVKFGVIKTNLFTASDFGAYKPKSPQRHTLGEMAGLLGSLIDQVRNNQEIKLDYLSLELTPSDAVQRKFRLDLEDGPTPLFPDLRTSVLKLEEENGFEFSVVASGIDSERYEDLEKNVWRRDRTRLIRWYTEMDGVLRNVLPHEPSGDTDFSVHRC